MILYAGITRRSIDNSCIERVEKFQIFGNDVNRSKFYSGRNQEQIEVRECFLLFGAESFVLQVAIQKLIDYDIQNYNFACSFVWV